jgi:hypothetical protein
MLESAQFQSLLIQQRISDLENFGKIRIVLKYIRNSEPFKARGPICLIDRYAYDAFNFHLYALSLEPPFIESLSENSFKITLSDKQMEIFKRYMLVFAAFLFWGDMEMIQADANLTIIQRS